MSKHSLRFIVKFKSDWFLNMVAEICEIVSPRVLGISRKV